MKRHFYEKWTQDLKQTPLLSRCRWIELPADQSLYDQDPSAWTELCPGETVTVEDDRRYGNSVIDVYETYKNVDGELVLISTSPSDDEIKKEYIEIKYRQSLDEINYERWKKNLPALTELDQETLDEYGVF